MADKPIRPKPKRKGTREESKRRLANLKKGYPVRDDEPFKDLPQSVREGAAERNPRIIPADKRGRPTGIRGDFKLPGESRGRPNTRRARRDEDERGKATAKTPQWKKDFAAREKRRKESKARLDKLRQGLPPSDGRAIDADKVGKKKRKSEPRPMIDPGVDAGKVFKDKASQKKKLKNDI